MLAGKNWLGQNKDASLPSPVVDQVRQLVGTNCTIFQRMNEAGDMLRVCTNVQESDGSRAIATYVPAVTPDKKPNPVVSQVLNGETYLGRAMVVGQWCVSAYEPIRDEQKRIVGMLYVGVPEQSAKSLRNALMAVQVGQTGYVFVLNATGTSRGCYVLSQGGKRDGEAIHPGGLSDRHGPQTRRSRRNSLSLEERGRHSGQKQNHQADLFRAVGLGDRRRSLRG
jgi:methyl-accepting chemotaxis protein